MPRSISAIAQVVLAALASLSTPDAHAADGCTVLLCLAGNWHSIPQCVPPVEQALRAMLFGGSFPVCTFVDGDGGQIDSKATGNYGANAWPTQDNCPPMYSNYTAENGDWQSCIFNGVISLVINGQPWTTMWWDVAGNTSTLYYPAALQQLQADQIDPRYANDLAQWQAEHPVPPQFGQGN